jgi:hypothetical protein
LWSLEVAVIVHYCDNCGIRIEPEDVQEGKAIVSGDKAYCPECAKKLNVAKQKPKKPPVQVPVRKSTTRVGPVRKKTTASFARRPRRDESGDEYERESHRLAAMSGSKKKTLPLLLGIGGVVVVVIIIAVLAGGSDKPPADRRNAPQVPGPRTPGDQAGYDTSKPGPYAGVEKPPVASAAIRKYQAAQDYGKRNPEDYPGVIERLESILNEEAVDFGMRDTIDRAMSEWNGRWDTAAMKEWDKTTEAAGKLTAKGDYEGAAKLYENFPEKYRKFYSEKSEKEIARLRKTKEAIEALKELEPDIKAAQKEFTVDEIDELEKLIEKLCVVGRKYVELDIVVEKLGPVVTRLKKRLSELEDEEWERDFGE